METHSETTIIPGTQTIAKTRFGALRGKLTKNTQKLKDDAKRGWE